MKIILSQKFNQTPLFIDLNKSQVIKLHNYTGSSIFLVSSHILAQLVNSDKEVFILDVFRVDSTLFNEVSNFHIFYNTKDFENNLRKFNPNNSVIFILSSNEELENILKPYKMNNVIFSQELSTNEDLLFRYDLEIYTIREHVHYFKGFYNKEKQNLICLESSQSLEMRELDFLNLNEITYVKNANKRSYNVKRL